MTAQLGFWGGVGGPFEFGAAGSGLGFYGANGFGTSVSVGAYQSRTFITDSTGTIQNAECNNCQYAGSGFVTLGQAGSGVPLTCVPNGQATLEIRFTNDTAVKCQNPQLIIYDRVSVNNTASGVRSEEHT